MVWVQALSLGRQTLRRTISQVYPTDPKRPLLRPFITFFFKQEDLMAAKLRQPSFTPLWWWQLAYWHNPIAIVALQVNLKYKLLQSRLIYPLAFGLDFGLIVRLLSLVHSRK